MVLVHLSIPLIPVVSYYSLFNYLIVRFGSVAASRQFITWAAGFGQKRALSSRILSWLALSIALYRVGKKSSQILPELGGTKALTLVIGT
jgi:hypothetical protein